MLYNQLLKFAFFCSIVCLAGVWAEAVIAQTSAMYAGVAKVDITPPVGYAQYRGTSTGVHDPLYAKAVVFREGDQQAALVVCDVIGITRDFSIEVRSRGSNQTGIPYENIIVAATHTHTGPRYHADMEEYVRKKRAGQLTVEDEESYPAWLIKRVAQALTEAKEAAVQVDLKTGSGKAEGISFNRRFIMKDGRVRFNPGVRNPDIIRPAGPIDPEVGIIVLRQASNNELLGSLTVFANHLDTVGGTEFSADYSGYLAKALNEALDENFISVFGLGACGNINHIDVAGGSNQKGHEAVTKPIGEKLAEVVTAALPNLKKTEHPFLAARSEFVYAPLQQYTREELQWAQKEVRKPLYNQRSFLEYRRMLKIRSLKKMRKTGEAIPPTIGTEPWTLPLEIQVFRIGEEAAIVGLPGEVFVELGMAIKKGSPFKTTLVIELTNSHIAYVPTHEAFSQGSYETINSRLAPGGGEMMVESAVRLLNKLKRIRPSEQSE